MNNEKEIMRLDKKIGDLKKIISGLNEEITALKQLLDCAAANIAMLVKEEGGKRIISASDVSDALGKYRLVSEKDENGNYVLQIEENE